MAVIEQTGTYKYTLQEGGNWHRVDADRVVIPDTPDRSHVASMRFEYEGYHTSDDVMAHSIELPDGRQWDTWNGWRKRDGR